MRKSFTILIVTMLLLACNSEAQQTSLSVPEFEKAIHQKDVQVLDVRTQAEYQSGHLPNVFLANWNNKPEFTERVASLDKSKPVYVYCLSGVRSANATAWLNENGFKAYNLAGGINAWKKENKPLEAAVAVKQISMEEYLASIPTDKTVLVDVSAPWCPPCKAMEPVLQALKKEKGAAFTLLPFDGSAQTTLCKALQIDTFPTFILYKKGKPMWRKTGIVTLNEFKAAL